MDKTPYEILTGNKPNISYFRVFGCKCFFLIKGVCLSKFESKAFEGIFVGYGAESHTYRVYNKLSGTVVESCSVVFKENDGSRAGKVDICDADVEIPQDAIRRMVVGFFRPIEEPLVVDRERQFSTQVEPSSTQAQHAPTIGETSTLIPQTAEDHQANVPESSRPNYLVDTGLSSQPSSTGRNDQHVEESAANPRPDLPANPGLSGHSPVRASTSQVCEDASGSPRTDYPAPPSVGLSGPGNPEQQ